jgi:hypothetical protein
MPTAVVSGGTGAILSVFLGGPLLKSRLYDEEMQVHYDETRQIVMADTPDSPDVDYVSEETRGIEIYRSLRIRTTKIPTAVNSATAIVSYAFQPYKFPGTLDYITATVTDGWLGYRSAKADLVQHKIKKWWQLSNTTPTVAFDEIVSDTVVIRGFARVERYSDVLHDTFITTYASGDGAGYQNYPETTPSYSEYYAGVLSGSTTDHNSITIVDGQHPGYTIGQIVTISGGAANAQIRITSIQSGGFVGSWEIVDEGLGGSYTNPVADSSGNGDTWNVIPYTTGDRIPGTAWVGTERVIAASVTPEKEKHLWKIETHTVVMR